MTNFNDSYSPYSSVCPHCGHMPLLGASTIDYRFSLPPNFYPWLGQCPECGHEQMISAYNVTEICEKCKFTGMRDNYRNDTHMPN